jgi:hypothetical protein
MRISRQPSPIKIIIDHKQWENVECFSYLVSIIINYAKCTFETKFHQQIGLKFKEETSKVLHLEHRFVLC